MQLERGTGQTIGEPGLANDPRFASAELRKRNEAQLDEIITEWTSQRDRWEITKLLQGAGVAAFPSMSSKDLTDDPHLKEGGYLVQREHPEVGRRIHAGIPWKMSGSPCSVSKAAPLLGEDTEAVLVSIRAASGARKGSGSKMMGFAGQDLQNYRLTAQWFRASFCSGAIPRSWSHDSSGETG